MTGLLLVLVIGLSAIHWLLAPLFRPLEASLQLAWLPWLSLAVAAWLLAGPAPE
jgi:hypothetical protein